MTDEALAELIAERAKLFRIEAEKSKDWDRYEKLCQIWLRSLIAVVFQE